VPVEHRRTDPEGPGVAGGHGEPLRVGHAGDTSPIRGEEWSEVINPNEGIFGRRDEEELRGLLTHASRSVINVFRYTTDDTMCEIDRLIRPSVGGRAGLGGGLQREVCGGRYAEGSLRREVCGGEFAEGRSAEGGPWERGGDKIRRARSEANGFLYLNSTCPGIQPCKADIVENWPPVRVGV